MATIYQAGYVFKDDGTAVSGATVQLYQADTTTTVGSSSTTNSSGYWTLSTTTEHTSGYDVKITSGSSIRYRRGNDKLQLEELDIRNDTGATQGGLLVANTTNSAANKVATFAGRNTTNADNDEIYITFEIHNDADEITEYARMTAVAIDVSNGSEDGEIQFDVMKAGTLTKVWSISSSTGGATSFDIETSTVTMAVDDFTIKSEDDGSAAILYMFADQGDDDADKWRIQVADGGTMTYASLISGSYVTHMTVTPHATVASSSVTIAGTLTMGSTAALTNAGLVAVANQSNITGVGTISSGTWQGTAIASTYIAADAITGAKIADDAINSEHYTDASIDTAHIAADQIVASLIADDAIDSEHYTDGSIDNAHIADDAIDSEHYADGSIDNAHIADDAIDSEHYADGSIDNAHIADDAIDSEHYAAASIDFAHIQNIAANSILGRDANSSGVLSEVALATTQILIGDGTGFTPAALSGDATMTNAGVVTVAAATTSADGISELATAAETTTGTDTARVVTPDGLAGSVVFGTRYVQCVVFDFATDIEEGNGKFYLHIPAGLNGMDLVEVHSRIITAGNGSTIDVQIHNLTDTSDMLSTSLTIDDGETGSESAGTAAVINASEDDVVTNDIIRIDVDGNGGDTTVAKGLIITLGFRLP